MAECSRGFKETIKQTFDKRIDAKSDSLEPEFSHYGKQKVDETDAMPNRLAMQ